MSIGAQNNVPLHWSNYEVTVALKLINADFLRNCLEHEEKLKIIFAQRLIIEVKTNCTVAYMKGKVEGELQALMPHSIALDVIELRIGERFSLPDTADLS